MLRYAITNSKSYAGTPGQQLEALVQETAQWAAKGIDLIQLREKHLPAGTLANLTRKIIAAVTQAQGNTEVLVNSRVDIAVAAGAAGVHLTSGPGELDPAQVRQIFQQAGREKPVISISCHTLDEVAQASQHAVDYILFGPIFGKSLDGVEVAPGVGLEQLRQAAKIGGRTRVLALGGMTGPLALPCLNAGAAGIAAIRLFQSLPHE